MTAQEAQDNYEKLSIDEATATYGEPIAYTRRGPVWSINGDLLYAYQVMDLAEIGCGC